MQMRVEELWRLAVPQRHLGELPVLVEMPAASGFVMLHKQNHTQYYSTLLNLFADNFSLLIFRL